jgi:hypothetical protein
MDCVAIAVGAALALGFVANDKGVGGGDSLSRKGPSKLRIKLKATSTESIIMIVCVLRLFRLRAIVLGTPFPHVEPTKIIAALR